MAALEKRVGNFSSYFESQLQHIDGLQLPGTDAEQLGLYRKSLLVSLTDALASVRFAAATHPRLAKANRERFTRFVSEHAHWPDGHRVSTPFLIARLEAAGLTGPLLDELRHRLAKFHVSDGNATPLAAMDFAGQLPLATRELEEQHVQEVQHWALLYRYRDHLVHEFREPKEGMDALTETSGDAGYHGYHGDDRFYLAYPPTLFFSVAASALKSLRVWLVEHGVDPYSRLVDTSRW